MVLNQLDKINNIKIDNEILSLYTESLISSNDIDGFYTTLDKSFQIFIVNNSMQKSEVLLYLNSDNFKEKLRKRLVNLYLEISGSNIIPGIYMKALNNFEFKNIFNYIKKAKSIKRQKSTRERKKINSLGKLENKRLKQRSKILGRSYFNQESQFKQINLTNSNNEFLSNEVSNERDQNKDTIKNLIILKATEMGSFPSETKINTDIVGKIRFIEALGERVEKTSENLSLFIEYFNNTVDEIQRTSTKISKEDLSLIDEIAIQAAKDKELGTLTDFIVKQYLEKHRKNGNNKTITNNAIRRFQETYKKNIK